MWYDTKYKTMFWHLSGGGRAKWLLRKTAIINSQVIESAKNIPYLPTILISWMYSKVFRHVIVIELPYNEVHNPDKWIKEETDIKYWLYTHDFSPGFPQTNNVTFHFIFKEDALAFKLRWV